MAVTQKNLDKIYIDIDGSQGNAFVLLGYAKGFAKDLGLDYKPISDAMTSGDYINLLKVFDKNFGNFVTLQTSNPEYLDAFDSFWTVKDA